MSLRSFLFFLFFFAFTINHSSFVYAQSPSQKAVEAAQQNQVNLDLATPAAQRARERQETPAKPSSGTPKENNSVSVQGGDRKTTGTFKPLTGGIPGIADAGGGGRSLVDYLNALFRFAIGLGALAAVLRITFAGIKYMTSEVSVSSKEDAKQDIQNAILGLLLLLSVVIILREINPKLLDLNFLKEIKDFTITERVYERGPTTAFQQADNLRECSNSGKQAVLPTGGGIDCVDRSTKLNPKGEIKKENQLLEVVTINPELRNNLRQNVDLQKRKINPEDIIGLLEINTGDIPKLEEKTGIDRNEYAAQIENECKTIYNGTSVITVKKTGSTTYYCVNK